MPATMQTDPMRLAQVLKNLLSNALKFTAKGSVGLQVSCAPQGMLSFAVRDTGIGIAEQQQQFIFDAFRQADGSTHRKFGGTGLGLSISRDLAGLLGGTLTVSSTPGQGSVFTPTVPVSLESAESGPATATTAAPQPQPQGLREALAASSVPVLATANVAPAAPAFAPPMSPAMAPAASAATDALRKRGQSGRRILVIEDDLRFADILSELAREMDFECDVANTASDGLSMAADNQPNAIVLDINLPDFSAWACWTSSSATRPRATFPCTWSRSRTIRRKPWGGCRRLRAQARQARGTGPRPAAAGGQVHPGPAPRAGGGG